MAAAVNMHEAKTNLSKLVESLVSGREREVVIARNGKPAVRMVAVEQVKPKRQLGLAAGKFTFDSDYSNSLDEEITRLFEEGADPYGEKLPR